MGYEKRLKIAANKAHVIYSDYLYAISKLGYKEKENFISNQLAIDNMCMFVQRISELSLKNDVISSYLVPEGFDLKEIRNSLSHNLEKNYSYIMGLTFLYLNNKTSIEVLTEKPFHDVNVSASKYIYKKNRELYVLEKNIDELNKEEYKFLNAYLHLIRIDEYFKMFKIEKFETFEKNEIIYGAVCFNLMAGLDSLRRFIKVSNKKLYKSDKELLVTRNKIAHEYEKTKLDKRKVWDAIKLFKEKIKETENIKNVSLIR